jgi:crotonobetainyl-CoA:carnitine CoA-transferase CaiB-like acyl-CoA transferase
VIKVDDPLREPNSYHLDVAAKRSILLDLRTPEGRDVFWQLAATADVVVQNFRPGVVERLGIDYAAVHRRKPDAVYATITAYGDDGPWAPRGGYEETVQALTGMQVRFGGADRPALLPFAVNDYGTAMLAAYGVGLALRHRARTGEGLHVTAALARTAGAIQSLHLQDYAGKTWDEPHGQSSRGWSPFQRLYQASDGWFFLGGGADAAQRVARIPGLEEVARLAPPAAEALLESRFRELPADTWVEGLRAAGLGAHRTTRVSQAMADPIAIAHGLASRASTTASDRSATTAPASGCRQHDRARPADAAARRRCRQRAPRHRP